MTSTTSPPSIGGRARTLAPVGGLVAWTLFVWVGRVRNIVDDDALVGWSRTWRLGLALSFVVLALVVGALALRQPTLRKPSLRQPTAGGPTSRLLRRLTGGLAAYGIVIWTVRGTDIALGAHGVAFKLVHSALAVVTILLGAIALRWASSPTPRGRPDSGPAAEPVPPAAR